MPRDDYAVAMVGEVHDLVYDVMLKSALILTIMGELDDTFARKQAREAPQQ